MEIGTILLKDFDFEKARNAGRLVEAKQGELRIYGPGKVESFSSHHVTVKGKKLHRGINQFVVVR